ncbi:MAG: DNA mismatch repair endonuclease MutL [Clostridia bacterium]|nr:DNA mismatch repair endonuclease MutL [Clostridia bacterium]
MAEIKVLPQSVADKIAAGEVVERPSAVVKELVENSIDARADSITVEIKNGGISYISIEDNGKGIPKDELESAFLRHATSKLREIEDLFEISTMGFRGEALSSICAVAEVRVISRTKSDDTGVCMTIKHGVASPKEEIACNAGTLMVVENLFANVPARMKFLKKDSTEAGYVTDVLGRIALARPEIAFRFICDGKEVFSTSGDGKLKNAILNIYGIDHAKAVLDVDYTEHGIRVSGVVGKAELARGNRTRQTLMVNGRYIKNHVVSKVVEEAFRNVLMTGKFPFFVLNIELSPSLVDVNVHPAKTEIKFANEKEIYNIVHTAVKNALYSPANGENKSGGDASAAVDSKRMQETPDRRIIREFLERTIPSTAKTGDEMAYTFNEPRPISKETLKEEVFSEPIWKGEITTQKAAPLSQTTQISFDFVEEAEEKQPEEVQTKVIGQVFDTYIIAQKGDEMFLIDQHAAHERKRFEMLKKDFCENSVSGQVLLSPIVFDLDMVEMQVVRENKDRLLSLGFLIEEFGKGSAIIRETPYAGDEDEIKSLAEEVISALMDNRPLGLLSVEERILDMVSCKYAIKANRRLSMLEMESALKDVAELEAMGITTCPHGRPIKISYSKYEIEKLFKRIV